MPTFRSTRKGKKCFFVMSLRLSAHKVLHNIASSSSFFRFPSDFLAFFAHISDFKFFVLKEFNETIIPFALVGYETGYSQLVATCLVGYLLSHIQRALVEQLLIINRIVYTQISMLNVWLVQLALEYICTCSTYLRTFVRAMHVRHALEYFVCLLVFLFGKTITSNWKF